MILSSWLTTVSNRIRNASARRRFSRKYKGNRFTRPASMLGTSTSYARPAGDIRESLWHTFDVAPRFHRDSRRFQRQVWNTSDVAMMTELLEDRTLLTVVIENTVNSFGTNAATEEIVSFTVPAGNDRAIAVVNSSKNILNSVADFAGSAFSEIEPGNGSTSIWVATLGDSGTATTGTITATYNGTATTKGIVVYALSGVDQTTPADGGTFEQNGDGFIEINSETGDLVLDSLIGFNIGGAAPPTITVGAGQTETLDHPIGRNVFKASHEGGQLSTRMNWAGRGGAIFLAHAGLNINQVASGPQPVNLSVSTNAGTEAGTTAITVTATADSAVTGNQTVDIAVTDSTTGDLTTGGIRSTDFTLSGTTITIPDGEATGSVTFTIDDDILVEGEETATLTISNPSAGIVLGSAVAQDVTITDNDTAGDTSGTAPAVAPDSMTDTINISINGGNVEVDVDGDTSNFGDPNDLSSLTVNGITGEQDIVNIDFDSNPALLNIGTINVNLGGDANDDVNVTVNGQTVTLDFTTLGAGSIVVGTTTINFTGVGANTVTIGGTPNDLTLDFPTGPTNDAIITNNTTAGPGGDGAGFSTVSSVNSAFSVNFQNPSDRLTINLGDNGDTLTIVDFDPSFNPDGDNGGPIDSLVINGGNGVDTINIQAVGGLTNGDITIDAGMGPDVLTLQAALNLGTAALVATADTINVNGGAVNTGAGNQTYNGSVTLGASTVLTGAQISLDAVSLGANNLTVANSGTSDVSGVVSGTGGLIKNGAGTLTLSGTNTYSGVTTINSGFIDITNGSALGSAAGNTVVNSDGGNNDGLRISGAITSPEPIVIGATAGAGSITSIGGGGGTLSGAITLNDAGADFRGGGNRLTFSGGINSAGNESLSLNLAATIITNPIDLNNGTLTVTSSGNNKANATQINVGGNDWGLARINFGGYALLGLNDALPTDAGVEFGWDLIGQSDATLDLNGFNQTVASIAQSFNSVDEGGNINITNTGGSASTLTLDVASGTSTYQGRLTGSGANALNVVKSGAGTQVIENLTTSGGNLVNHNHASTTVNGGTLKFLADATLNTFDTSGAIEGIPNNITINGGTLAFEDTAADNRMVHQDDTITFGAAGGGTLDYVAGNFLFQGTAINPTPPEDTFVTTGGAKNLITSSGGTARINPQGGNTVRFDVADGTDAVDLELAVNFENGTLRKLGDGVLTLTNSVNAVNPNTGPGIIIDAGTLDVAESGRLNSGSYARDITINNDGVFRYSSDQNQTLSGTISGSGSLEGGSSSTLTLAGSNITLAGGSVDISNPVIISNDLTIDTTNGGAVAAGADVTFGGTINSNGGNNNLTIDAGNLGEVELSGAIGTTDELRNLSIDADSIIISGGTVTTINDQTYDGDVTLGADSTINANDVTFHGTVDGGTNAGAVLGSALIQFATELNANFTSIEANLSTLFGQHGGGGTAIPHSFTNGEVLDAAELNANFTSIEANLGTLFGFHGGGGTAIPNSFTNPLPVVVAGVSLTVASSSVGVTTFNGEVGGTTPLKSITTNADGLTELGADINTEGSTVTFNDDVLLTGNVVITETGTGDVTFNGDVDSTNGDNYSLTVDTAGGKTIFNGRVNGDAQGAASDDAGLARTISVDNLQFNAPGTAAEITLNIDGITAGTLHDEIVVTGTVNLGSAKLNLDFGTFTPQAGDEFILVSNDGTDAITGIFKDSTGADLAEGTTISNFGGSGLDGILTYKGGSEGNDVTITVVGGEVEVPTPPPGSDDTFSVEIVDGFIQVTRNGMIVSSTPVATGSTIVINGSDGNDVLNIDDSADIPAGGIIFNGGDGNDDINIDGTSITVELNGTANEGTITVDGGTIEYTGVEQNNTIAVTPGATTVVDITGGGTITFTRENATTTRVSQAPGGDSFTFTSPSTLLDVNFNDNAAYTVNFTDMADDFNPSNGIDIDGGGGDETVTVTSLGAAFNQEFDAQLGGGDDSVTFQTNNQSLASLTLTAETITATAVALTVAGATSLTAGTGTINLNNAGHDFQGTVTVVSGGTTTIRDTNALTLGNSSTSGTTTLTAGTNLTLNNLNASGQTVSLTATAGLIADGNGGTNNVTATSLTASAATGIDLDTTITTLTSATTTGSGAINISDSAGGLTATTVSSNDGSVTLNATGGDLTIGTSLSAGGNNNALLTTTTSGNVILTGTTTATANQVTITSAGSINGAGLVTAATIDLNAASGIGNTTALELAGTTITADTTTGNVDIDNALATATTYTSISTDTGSITVDNSGGGTATFTSVTTSGNIDLENTGNDLTATSVVASGSGDITLTTTTSGDVLVGLADAAADTVTITSAGAIEESGADAAVDIDGRDVNLTAVTGIGGAATIEIDAFGGGGDGLTASVTGTGNIDVSDRTNTLRVLDATTNDGSITINANDGNMTVETATAGGSNNLTLTTTTATSNITIQDLDATGDSVIINATGAIIDGGAGQEITASNAALSAANGIGSGDALETTISTLAFTNSASNNVEIDNTGDLAINTVNGLTSSTNTGGGNIAISSTGDVTVTHAVDSNTGDVTLQAVDDILVNGSIDSDGGAIVLHSDTNSAGGGGIAITANVTSTNGNITIGGGADPTANAAMGTAATSNDGVRIDGATVSSGTGNISMIGQGLAGGTTGRTGVFVVNGGAVQATTGSITATGTGGSGTGGNNGLLLADGGSVSTTTGGITLTGTGGSGGVDGRQVGFAVYNGHTIQTVDGTVTIIGTATNGNNAGASVGSPLLSTAGTITTTGTGTISITGTAFGTGSGVDVVEASTVQTTGTAGTISFMASSPVLVDGGSTVSGVGNVTLSATEDAGAVAGDNVTVTGNSTVTSTGGDVTINAGDNIVIDAGSMVTAPLANVGDVTLNSGVGDNDNIANQTLDGTVSANTTDGVITLNLGAAAAASAATQAASGTITAANLRLLSSGANGSFALGTSSNNDVDVIAAATTGAISFRDDDGVTVGTVTTVGITTSDDAVTIDSSQGAGGMVTVDQAITTAGTGTTGTVELSGAVDINASLTAAGGSITLRGVAGATSDIDVGAAVTSAASIDWAANRDIIISATVQTTQAGTDITLTADSDMDGSGGVRIATAGQVNAVDEVTITGSDLFASGAGAAPIDSVDIQQDGANAQVTAGGNIGIASGAAAAGTADIRVAGIVQSTGTGNVTINANNDLVITVDGDVTSAGGNLNLDGGQDVLIDGSAQVTTTGAGTIDIDAVRSISISGAATLVQTVNGNLTMVANAGGTSGTFHGVIVNDATVTSADGNVSITGTGGDAAGPTNQGIRLENRALIQSTGTGADAGTVTLMGTGGNGGTADGIVLLESQVASVDGAIQLTGTSAQDAGVAIVNSSTVSSTGTGTNAATITVMGTSMGANVGVLVNGAASGMVAAGPATITAVDGDIQITGNASNGDAVRISNQATVTSTGTTADAGTIIINGMSTGGGDGVRMRTSAAQVASARGAIEISGIATAGDGVEVEAGVTLAVSATNSATVSITGTGGTGEVAVQIDSPISSGTGTVTITANDGNSATDDITFGAAGDITSTSGAITINADNAGNTADVTMADGAVINAGTGTVEIIADVNFTVGEVITSGLVNAVALAGSVIDADAGAGNDITAGSLAISGETGVGSDADSIETTVSTLAGRANSGDFNISNTGNLDLGVVALATLAQILFAPETEVIGVTIEDSADNNSTDDNITIVTAGSLTVSLGPDADGDNGGVDNNDGGNITLTANGATADLTISAPVNVSDGDGVQDGIGNIDFEAGRDVIINNDALVATDASGQILVDAVRRIDVSSNAATTMIQSIDGAITMNANAAMTSTGEFFGIVIDDASITTSTGAITVTGVGGNSGNSNHGVRIQNGALVESTGNAAGTISIDGTGRAGVFSEGIRVADAATLIQSVDANIALTGVTASDNGVEVNEATVRTTGTGTIVIDGTSTGTVSSGTANNGSDGVLLAGSSALITTTGPGAATISISGQSAGDEGIELNSASVSTVGSLATVSLSGSTTATGGSNSDGIRILGADARISSASGEISITGETNGGGTAGDGVEIAAGVTLAIDADGTAGITISGTGDGAESGVQIDSPIESEMGAITIRSEDGGSTTDDITFGADGDITSTSGLITIDADTATSNTADVFMADGAVIDAGSGQIDIDADVNVTLGSIQTTSTADPAIEIDALAGAVIDGGDADIDIATGAGGSVVIRSMTGIGSGDALETDLNASILAASNTTSGTIEIDDVGANTGLLTIGTVDGLAGITNQTPDGGSPSTTGFISVSNASPIDVVDNITANGDITLTTGDTDAINVDNLFIDDVDTLGNDLLIESTGGSITLNVGDDAVIEGDLTAASIITINIDQPGAAGDDAVVLTGGGTLDIRLDEAAGTAADAVLTTTGGTFINGGSQDDTFIFQAQSTTNFVVNGNPPAFGDAGVPPGDTLRLDFTNVVNPPILATGIPGAGVFSFQALPAPGDDELSVSYSNIETVDKVNGTVNYHLVIDPTLPGSYGNQTADPDNTRDDLTVRLNPDETGSGGPAAGTDLIIERTAAPGGDSGDFVGEIFRGTLADILSLTIQGTDDDETLTIDESNGLPSFNNAGGFAAVAPSTRGIDNALREIWFNGSFSNSDLDLDNVDLNNLVINDSDLLSRDRGTTTLLEGPLSYTGATANTRSGNLTGTTTHAGAWVGSVIIGPAGGFADPLEEGVVTFGTESNDGSQFWVDLDQDGIFSRTGADGDELIVDNSAVATDVGGAPVNAVGTVDFSAGGLGAGVYSVAITYYTRTAGTEGIEARFAQGNVAYGAATVIDPSAAGQQGLWRSERLDNVHLTNADDGNDRAEFVFIGRGGTNAVVYNLGSASTVSQTYAIGDGLGGGDNSASGHSEGAILTRDDTNSESQLFYFTGLEPITVSGTAGGRLTILGDNEDNLINIEDDATTAGNTLITASTPTAGSGVGTYESYSFAANTFANIDVFGMLGADLIDLIAMDANQNSSMIELNGDDTLNSDTSDDTIRVRSYPAGNMSSLFGGAGDDTFNIFDAANTVDNILGRMMIDGEGGTDTVIVDDSGSNPAGDDGETVTVNIPPGAPNLPGIDGIFGEGAGVSVLGTDIILANVTASAPGSVEVLTVSTSADNDDINVDMNGVTATDLTTITINGSDGSDLFNIQSDTPADATTNLNGNAGADQFFFEAGGFVVTGAIDGGADNDALDYSAYNSGRTIQLTDVGSTDGFQGNDATAGGTSIAPVAAASFDNIDILIGTSMDDTLIGADLRNHWDIGGDIDGFDDAHFNPTGGARTDGGLQLVNSLADAGVLIADESDLSLTGNATTVGRPTGANPIVPNAAGEQDLAFTDFQFFVGALTADDHFDLRDGASVTGTIDGRGGSDSIDYRDFSTAVNVDLNTGTATNVNVAGGGAGAGQAGGLVAGTGGGTDDNSIENAFGGDADDIIAGDNDNNILGDGFGNDQLFGDRAREGADPTGITSGNDTFRLEPRAGDNDIVFDLAGSDTVDFRFATQGIVYDADIVGSTATPFLQDVFNGAGATVDLRRNEDDGAGGIPQPATGNTPYENVVGSQFNDIIHIDPLSISGNFPTEIPVNRFVDGNDPFVGGPDDGIPPDPGDPIPPGDILRFDGKGAVVQDTGLSLTAQGVGTVAYRSIETITSFDDAPRIIDNGDDAVTTFPNTTRPGQNSATWNVISNVGFQDDYLFSVGAGVQGTDNPNIVTWTANGVADGLYRISLTWPDLGVQNGASSTVPVQIFDGDTLLATLSVNQRLAPSDLLDEGVFWDDLGIFNFQTHTARIVLSNDTEGTVLADAVRLEQISPNPELQVELQDTGEYIADGVDIVDVTTVIEQPQTRTFTVSNDGTADLMITDIELEQNGGTNWELVSPLGTSFTLPPGQSTFLTVTLLATTANGQADFPAELRIFSNDVDENVLQLPGQGVNPDPDGDPLNDVNPFTIPLNGVVSTVDIIDDTDVRFDTVGVWEESGGLQSVPNSFGTGIKTAPNDGDGERALWTFSDLPDGRYRVSVTWPNEERLNLTTVEYRVRNSSSTLATTQVDQSVAPAGLNANGTTFQDLGGPFDITDGTIIVELRDTKIGTIDTLVVADAVRIERLFDTVADATLFDGGVGGTEVADDTGVVSFGTVLPGTQVQKTFTVRNDGMQDLTVREPVSLPAGYTLISFNGAAPTNATEVTLMPGQTVDFVVQLNASTAGVVSGEMSFATGELAGGANADPDENPINVTLTATVQSTVIVDNHDPGFSTTGNAFQLFLGGPQGYNSEGNRTIHIADANGTGDTAVWTIPVEPGGRYRIGATYTLAAGNGPTNAPYTVAGVVGGTTVPINQRVLPDDRFANGSAFEDLGVFVADGTGTITVTLADTGNGAAVADAIRVEALFGPEIEVLDNTSGTNLQDGASTVDFGDTTQGSGALSRTFTITNDGERELALGTISLPNNFQLAGTFPTSIAANGGTGTFTLQLTTADAGTFGGVVSFTNDDADESPFNFNVTGTVIGAAPVIIDNGDPGFSSVGLFNSQSNGGRNGTYFQALNGDGSSVATWQFTGLAAGVYNVAATWGGYFIRATNAPYTITDSTGSTTVEVNQRLDPDDFTENFMGITASWENLGQSFVVDGTGTLTVTLSNLADNYVYADAIRVERTGALPEIVVTDLGPDQVVGGGNDVNLPDGGTFDFGSVTPGVPVTRTFQITNAGTAALTTGTLTLPSGFSTTYTPQTLAASGTATFDITYDALADATGTFSFPTNDDDESPFNFTLTGTVAATVTVIDDGDAAFMTPTGGFSAVTTQNNEGFQGDIRTATGDASGNTATWTFSGLVAGGTYRVSSTWFPFFNRATDAPFTISGIDGGPLTVDVNQRLIPGSFTENGEDWLDLELVRVSAGGEITVTLSDDANGLVVADAIRVEQVVGNEPEIVVHNGGLVIADGSTFNFGTVGQNGTLSQTFTVVNSGQTDLTVQTPILPPGFTTPFTTTTIAAGDTADIVVSVTTSEQANLSGAMSISSNDGNESPFNLNLQATVEGPTPTIIDNGDLGFAAAGGFSAFNGQGFMGDVHFVNGGNPGATATYSFTGLADGQYLVSTTWTPLSDRASDAPYTVTDSVNGGVTIDISQRNAPDDFNADGVSWEELGIFTVSGGAGSITVQLTGDADNIVIADAVRLDPVVGAEITVLEGSTVIDLGGTVDFGDVVQGTANVTRTITVRNDGPEDLILQPIPALTGFTVSNSNFTAGQMLATGATASFDITIDTSSLGSLTDVLEFSNNDADEGPFRFTVTGNIVADVIVPLVIDNGDATGYTQVGDFTLLNGPGFLNDMVQDTTPNAGGGMATWTFSDLDAGTYRVSATWDAFYAYPQASNAPFTISGIDGGPVTVNIDQRVNPDDFTFQGEAFEDLGVFTLSGSTITVSLSDMADGSVLADAIRIEQITGSDITVAQGGTDLLSGSSTVAFDSQVEGGTGESITFTVSNVGPANLVLQPVVVGAGFVVTDNFTAGDMVATSATDTFTIQLDTSTPGDFSATVSLPSNDPDENPFVFTVTGTVTMNTQPLIIDNNDAGFSSTPNFVTMGGQGYNATVLQSDNTDAGVATWTFTGLPAGTYRVGATWTTAFDLRATDAMYSIAGGAAIVVNQRQHPVQSGRPFILDGGSIFADLDSGYAHAGGDLTITLSDTPTGVVIADAIRLERLAPLQVRGGQVTPAADVQELDQQDAVVAEVFQTAVDIWAGTDLTADQSDLLSTVTFHVRDLTDGHLGAASNHAIFLDINGAGYGWFVDSTPLMNEEFELVGGELVAVPGGPADGQIDLLTVVLHELGHVIGLEDLSAVQDENDLMFRDIAAGLRRLPDGHYSDGSVAIPVSRSSLDLTSGRGAFDGLNQLLETPLLGSQTPAALYADRRDEETTQPVTPPDFTRTSGEDTSGIDTLFTLQTEENNLTPQIPFDEI